ncbi:HAD hydrolase family protein, partial [Weissella soli]
MSRKLIGIDLDGTTLNEKSQVSERTRHILQAA